MSISASYVQMSPITTEILVLTKMPVVTARYIQGQLIPMHRPESQKPYKYHCTLANQMPSTKYYFVNK